MGKVRGEAGQRDRGFDRPCNDRARSTARFSCPVGILCGMSTGLRVCGGGRGRELTCEWTQGGDP